MPNEFKPKHLKRFVESLEPVLQLPITFSGSYIRPVSILDDDVTDYDAHQVMTRLTDNDETASAYLSYIHQWFPANPAKQNVVERGNELYVNKVTNRPRFNTFLKRKLANMVLVEDIDPSKRKYNIEKIIDKNRCIFVEGAKGVGKTTFFNFWLNNRSSHLESNKGKIWFRVDASKLYGIWSNYYKGENYEQLSLELYHKVHTVYVTAKYGSKNEGSTALAWAWKYLISKSVEDNELSLFLETLARAVKDSDKAADGKDTERFIHWAIRKDALTSLDKIYNVFFDYWLENQIKVIFIVDGVDNVSWTRESAPYYDHLCDELGSLFLNDFRNPYCDNFGNIIIVVRPETFKDIENRSLADHLNTDIIRPYARCLIAPTCVEKILTHKSSVTLNPKSIDIKNERELSKDKIEVDEEPNHDCSEDYLKQDAVKFSSYSKHYLNNLMGAIRKRYTMLDNYYKGKDYDSTYEVGDFEDTSTLVEIMFNDNIRACVDNFIKNYSTIKLAKNAKVPGCSNPDRYPQYLLLNGRIFLDSPKVNTRVRGESYPNIFWWNHEWANDEQSGWYGMSVVRILQLLNSRTEVRLSYLIEAMQHIFSYPKLVIDRQVARLIKYGMLEYSEDRTVKDDYFVSSTKKGKFILEYMFMYTDWLYFCALDTPLDSELCQDKDSRYVKIHRDLEFNFLTSFNTAYITTIITFCRHLTTQQHADKLQVAKKWERYDLNKSQSGLFRNEAHANSIFSLPEHFTYFVKRDLNYLFLGLYEREELDAKELYTNLVGLYPTQFLLTERYN